MVWFWEIKDIALVLQKAWKIDEYNKIIELQSQLLDMQNTIQELSKENISLKDKFKIKEEIIYRNNAYYIWTDWPYCSRCWDKNKDLIRIIPRNHNTRLADCPECKTWVNFTWEKH